MRWLERFTPRKRGVGTRCGSFFALSSGVSNGITAASITERQPCGEPSEVEESLTITSGGDNFNDMHRAAASSLGFRERPGAGERASARPGFPDSLSSSFMSFVEGVGSQLTSHLTLIEALDSASASLTGSGLRDADVCAKTDQCESSTPTSSVTPADPAALSPLSALETSKSTITRNEDLLVADIQDHIFRRGIDRTVALGAARVCLEFIQCRGLTLEEIQGTKPSELVSLATAKLGLSSGAAACLLCHLVHEETSTASSYPCFPPDGVVRAVDVAQREKAIPACLRHKVGTTSIDAVLSGTEKVVALGWERAEATAAATALVEAYCCFGEVVEAASNMMRRPGGQSGQGVKAEVNAGVIMADSEEKAATYAPYDCSSCSSEELPRPSHSPVGTNCCSIAATSTAAAKEDEHDRVRNYLQRAIRAVTSGANNCYGQLVVLGYKEFIVRDSTWHRVGSMNTRFALARRETPNGVHVDGGNASTDGKTPELRPHGLGESLGRRNPPHRARGGMGTGSTTAGGGSTAYAGTRAGCRGVGEDRGTGGTGSLSSAPRTGARRDAPGGCIRWESPYRLQLSLSAQQQRGAASARGCVSMDHAEAEAVSENDVVTIPCSPDDSCDMYQLGRMEGGENDFAVRGPLHESKPGGKVCGPVSRYAARILVDRAPPHRCRIFAGGFNTKKLLTLPRTTPKWRGENGEWDAVTPFGVRVLKPEVGKWREVTVAGAVRQPRAGRLDTIGDLVADENNELTCGTVIDVGGVQILYESAESMGRLGGTHPSRVLEELNGRKPQCPVQLQTLRFRPWQAASIEVGCGGAKASGHASTPGDSGLSGMGVRGGGSCGGGGGGRGGGGDDSPTVDIEDEGEKTDDEGDDEEKALVPHIFPACGHVQGYAKQLARGPCPMCRTPGNLVEVRFGWCPAIDRQVPTVVFNPCGHAASLEVAERWSMLAMPNNAPPDAVYRPICPYCAKPLQRKNGERPFSKMIFALP